MKKTTFIKRLNKAVEDKVITKNSSAYKLISGWIIQRHNNALPYIRPCWTSGYGRYKTNLDYTHDVERVLQHMKIKFVSGNDAPKGGKVGNFIKITHKVLN